MTTPPPPRGSSESFTGGGSSFGRDFRLILGGLAIIGDIALLYMEHVHMVPPATYTTPDVIMHVVILVLGVFLMDPKRTLELIASVKDKIPGIGK